jgi:hypothetical protein
MPMSNFQFLPLDAFISYDAVCDNGLAGSPSQVITEAQVTVGGLGLLTGGFVWLQSDIWNPSVFNPSYAGTTNGWSSVFGYTSSIYGPTLINGWTSSFGFTFSLYGPTLVTGWTNSIF